MLVTFSCDAHENIMMFGDVAQRLLKMMGHSGTVPSAILADEVPEALANLQQALTRANTQSASVAKPLDEEDDDVSLANRAWPLLELLRHAAQHKCNVMWR